MGFLDKVKSQAEQVVKQSQDAVEERQAQKRADGLLRDLGAWYYAVRTDRDQGQGQAEMDRILGELEAHEAEHGPLGGGDDDDEPPGTAPELATTPESAPTPPPPPGTPPTPGTPSPPPPAPTVPPGGPPPMQASDETDEPGPY